MTSFKVGRLSFGAVFLNFSAPEPHLSVSLRLDLIRPWYSFDMEKVKYLIYQ